MIRIGVFSDTHIGRNIPRVVGDARRIAFREAFRQAIDIFINSRVDYVLHCGDLFEKRSMSVEDVNFVKNEFYRLVKTSKEIWGKDVKIIAIRGNHDGALSSCVLEYVTHPVADYFQVIGETLQEVLKYYKDDRILVVGLGHHPHIRSRVKKLIKEIDNIIQSSSDRLFRILLLHNYVENFGDIPPSTPEQSVVDLQDLRSIDVDLVILGHYHEGSRLIKFNGSSLLIPGATEAIDLGEKGPFKIHLLDIDEDKKIEEKAIELTPSHHISIRKVFSPDPKPLEWFKNKVLEEITDFIAELEKLNMLGILKVKVNGVVTDVKIFSKILLEDEINEIKEKNSKLLYLEIEEDLTPLVKEEVKDVSTISSEEMFKELFKELGDEPSILELVDETSIALEEKASEKTGILKDSDRANFIERWVRILMKKAGEDYDKTL
ncbi:MAG: glutamate-cysteine ligase family protein [Aigarchaeota archaeon]|nr:glutamate-cysteine ligase family protein [Aigarchaeota archaeon]MCX8192500.1 glutamate-cysteine ligase family protein [Nitrososphaeria archaeon]MDW7985764.1 metallophosphoesterase [Nitrososphaerota archaeon]